MSLLTFQSAFSNCSSSLGYIISVSWAFSINVRSSLRYESYYMTLQQMMYRHRHQYHVKPVFSPLTHDFSPAFSPMLTLCPSYYFQPFRISIYESVNHYCLLRYPGFKQRWKFLKKYNFWLKSIAFINDRFFDKSR